MPTVYHRMAGPATVLFPVGRRETMADRLSEECSTFSDSVNLRSFRKTFVTWLRASGADGMDIIRLCRDRGRGAERLVAWNYTDDAQIDARLRAALARMEAWVEAESSKREAM